MHPVAEYRAQVEQLRKELADLKAALVATRKPEPEPIRPAWGPQAPLVETGADADARWHAEARRREAAADAEYAKAREGLPAGFFRDPTGIVRTSDGQIAAKLEREIDEANAVTQAQAQAHRAWKRLTTTTPTKTKPTDQQE